MFENIILNFVQINYKLRTGRNLGKMKRGAKLRSFDIEEKEKFLRTCPCKVETWQRPVVGEDGKVTVIFATFTE